MDTPKRMSFEPIYSFSLKPESACGLVVFVIATFSFCRIRIRIIHLMIA